MAVLDPAPTVRSHRLRRRVPPYLLGLALLAAWGVMFVAAPHVRPAPGVRELALFVHLAALVLGFGAVLTLDWVGLMWMLGRHDLMTLVRVAQVVHTPVWVGLGALTLSGVFLTPDTSAPLTVVKLVAVLAVALNGLGAAAVQRRMLALDGAPPPLRLLLVAVTVATVSQVGWWTATLVGFLNAQR
jgi:hypothetical protein